MRWKLPGVVWTVTWVLATAVASAQSTRPADPPIAETSPPATQPSSQPVDLHALAKDLSSPNWQVRRTARETFIRLGYEAKPTLEQIVQNAQDEEARHQAQEALALIEENVRLGPSYITLHVKDAKPEEVFAEISKQCHTSLTPYPENLWSQGNFKPLTLDVDRKPFWEVMPSLCQHYGVDFTQFQTGLRIMRTGMNRLQGITEVDGPFLVVANQITYTRTRSLVAGRGENSSFSMSLFVYPEPKITLMHGITNLKLIEAVDDHGNSLLPPVNGRSVTSGGFGAGAAQLYAPLIYPRHNPGTKIARFRANASFNVQTKSQQIQIADLMKMKDHHESLKSMDVTFKEVTQKNDVYELKLVIYTSPLAPPEFRNIYEQVQNNLHLLDDRGQELQHRGMSSSPVQQGAEAGLEITLQFGINMPGRPPEKLVWDVPTEFKEIIVPIHFNDIPLFENN